MASSSMALLSVPTPHHHQSPIYTRSGRFSPLTLPLGKAPCKKIPCLASSSSGTEELAPQPDSSAPEPSFPPGSCQACGKAEKARGCNGEGRIQGGIATVTGFGWWPIKAYRPCPGFVESGGRYKRFGQSMDDVVSGRGRRPVDAKNEDNDTASRKPSPKKFTR